MNPKLTSYVFKDQPLVINDRESATKIADLLINKLQELHLYMSDGKASYDLLKQLKDIIFCIYYSAETEYTVLLHDIVSYVLVQIFEYEN